MSLDDIADAFLQGKLVLETPEMELVQIVEKDPIIFRGPGRIVQDQEGKLSLEMTALKVINTDMVAWMNAAFNMKVGVVLGPEYHYRLRFADAQGRWWTAGHIRPNFNWRHDADPVLTDDLRSLKVEDAGAVADGHSLRMTFLTDEELPPWSGVVKELTTAFGVMEVRRAESRLDVCLSGETPQPEGLDIRIEEAFRFLTAKDVAPSIVIASTPSGSTWELRSPASRMGKTNLNQPLSPRHIEYVQFGWPMFVRYFEYVATHGDPDYWHPITYHLHNAAAASANSIDGWAVGMSVAVEGLVNLVEMPPDPDQDAFIGRFQTWIGEQMAASTDFAALSTRVMSMLGNMGTPSARDRLHHVVKTGAATKKYATAWGKLRNAHVHPRAPDLKVVGDADFDKMIKRLFQVMTLLYEISFHLIGYDGPYQDYGKDDFPVRHRPARTAPAEGTA